MNRETIRKILNILKRTRKLRQAPVFMMNDSLSQSPFYVLVSTFLSSRTKDEVTINAARRLFKHVKRPEDILKMEIHELERLIYPVGFYRTKARRLKDMARILLERFEGKVPHTLEELQELPGVGRKTANLVLSRAFNRPALSVDTHVHRIARRTGMTQARTPHETEYQLREKIDQFLWKDVNTLFVALGQMVCKPQKPQCNECPIKEFCEKNLNT